VLGKEQAISIQEGLFGGFSQNTQSFFVHLCCRLLFYFSEKNIPCRWHLIKGVVMIYVDPWLAG
jgi:hypothetical protein